jgi:hypothetical protein
MSAKNPESVVNDKESCDDKDDDDYYYLDEDVDNRGEEIFVLFEPPGYVALLSYESREPFYIVKVIEKGIAEETLRDNFGHCILKDEYYFKGYYLTLTRSKHVSQKQFKVVKGDVLCLPSEIFDIFLEISESLTMDKEVYCDLLEQSKM